MYKKLLETRIDKPISSPQYKHICLFYNSKKELINLLAFYFKRGLERNEFCVCITSKALEVKEVKKAFRKKIKNFDNYIKNNQMVILNYSDWYVKKGEFNPDKVLQQLLKKEKEVLKQGFIGIRGSGDTAWLKKKDFEKWIDYEKMLNENIDKYRIIALCTYPRNKLDLNNMFYAKVHHHSSFTCDKDKIEHF